MRLRLALAFVLVLGAAACGTGPGEQLRIVRATVDRAGARAHDYTYVDETLDGKERIVVEGHSYDDLRYEGVVSLNGKQLYEMIVSEDAVALRIIDKAATQSAISRVSKDPLTDKALMDGRWVVDFIGAPPLNIVRATRSESSDKSDDSGSSGSNAPARDSNPIGNDPFFSAADALRYTQRNLIFGVGEFNPDDIEYNPADDPWRADADRDLRDKGIRRWDYRQPQLPPRAGRGAAQRLPFAIHFRKMALYVKGERAFEVQEQISVRDRKEFRRAESGRSARYFIQLRDAALRGAVSSPFRERRMTYTISPFTGGPITLPTNAEKGLLKNVIGERGLPSLFHFKVIGQGEGGVPVLPGGLPGASAAPARTKAPAASPSTNP